MRLKHWCRLSGALVALCAMVLSAQAEPPPRWEAGLGLAALTLPDYRGSEQQQVSLLPIPYVIYRGEQLRADRDGVRGEVGLAERVHLAFSASGTLSLDSDDNPRRQGMPALDPTFEVGPALHIDLAATEQTRWQLRLPVRWVAGFSEEGIDHVGWLAHPQLRLTHSRGPWRWRVSAGPQFADASYHDYYYGVAPRYARPDRPAYVAESGYSGTSASLSLSRRQGAFWYGAFIRYDYLAGATFADSPLRETDHAVAAGIALSWVFAQSADRASWE